MYDTKDFSHLLGIDGLSDELLNNHFTLYGGYVTNTNKLIELLKAKEVGTPDFAELHRRFAWEWNGMRLHELYFENLTKNEKKLKDEGELKKVIDYVWGSFENWQKEFVGIATMRGIGWVALAFDPEKRMVFNVWINEHDLGHLAGCTPILVMDVFEHAYMTDYGTKRVNYIDKLLSKIDWEVVEKRFGF